MSTSENTARRVDEVDAEDTAATTSAWVPQDRVMNDSTLPPATQQPILSSETTTSSAPRTKNSMTGRPPTKKVGRFGLADWTRLLASSTDLAQRKGQPVRKKIAWKEIRQHRHVYDGWTVIKGKVYNISPYLAYHPGGEFILRLVLGKDATSLFDRYHRWVNEDAYVQAFLSISFWSMFWHL